MYQLWHATLQFTSSFNHHGADAKVHPNGGNEVLIVAVIRKAKQQTGLSHAWTVTIHFNAFQPFHKVYWKRPHNSSGFKFVPAELTQV